MHGYICCRPFSYYVDIASYRLPFRLSLKKGNYLMRYGCKILCNFGILGISLLSDVQLWTLNIHVAAMKKTSMNLDRRMLRET